MGNLLPSRLACAEAFYPDSMEPLDAPIRLWTIECCPRAFDVELREEYLDLSIYQLCAVIFYEFVGKTPSFEAISKELNNVVL